MSAPNLRLLLNGNNRLLLLALLFAVTTSCELFQPVQETRREDRDNLDPIQGRRVYDEETGEWVVISNMLSEELDTINWRELPESEFPPIVSSGAFTDAGEQAQVRTNEYGSEFYNAYNVAVVLPFLTDRFDPATGNIDPNSSWALHFYSGARMALQQLESEGVSLKLDVLDSKASTMEVTRLIQSNPALRQSHFILGPYLRDNISELAKFAKQEEITMASPYSAAMDLTDNNPHFIQMSPTLPTHCAAIARHALERFDTGQIVLVSRDDPAEKSRLQYFQSEHFRRAGSRNATKLQEFIIGTQTGDYSDLNNMPFIQLQDTTVFLIPSWEENFVYSFLRKLDLAKEEYQHVIVYGMPQWMRFQYIDLDYYEKMNVHVSSNYYLDPLAPSIQFFKRKYFEDYGAVAPLEAFLGFDAMLYFGRMLKKHGTKFQYLLESEPEQYLHTRFEFERVVTPTTTGVENPPVERFENKYVHILRFKDYQFQLTE